MLLSIIIPVYNIEHYVGACINSVLNQSIDSEQYEIIVVDDGSKDGSLKIIEAFAIQNNNIIVHKQQNVGLGGARKSGLKLAKGKYVYFLDGDDYLANNTLRQVLDCLEINKLDILGFNVTTTNQTNLVESTTPVHINTEVDVKDGISFIGANDNYRVEVWWYLINREFLLKSGLTFEDKRFVNDSYFTPTLFINAKRVAFIPIDIYRYVQRENSITSNKNLRHYEKHIKDLEYAIFKMDDIIATLCRKPSPNQSAIEKIKIKQESYVFFSIVRFLKSDLKTDYLIGLLKKYKNINAYPIRLLLKGKEYSNVKFSIITFIFNTNFLLFPCVIFSKSYYGLKRKIFT